MFNGCNPLCDNSMSPCSVQKYTYVPLPLQTSLPSFKLASFFSPSFFVLFLLTLPLRYLPSFISSFRQSAILFSSFSFSPFYFSNPSFYYPFVLKVGHLDTLLLFPVKYPVLSTHFGGKFPVGDFDLKTKTIT